MTNRFFSPNQQFINSAGTPYANGSLTFYVAGTSTLQATFSNQTLTTPNANPLPLDSSGRAGAVFLSNAAYKVVLSDSLGQIVWVEDQVYSSDFSTPVQFLVFAGNPNGSVAGNQGTSTTPASVIYDSTDNLIYVCTTTGNAASAVWTAVNSIPPGATPTGMILPFATATASTGFLACDGSSYLRASFTALFNVIGTTYGAVDGSHFNVPDIRGRCVFGLDNMGGSAAGRINVAGGNYDGTVLGNSGGGQNHTLIQAELPAVPACTFTGTGLTGTGTISPSSGYAQGGTFTAETRTSGGSSGLLISNANGPINPTIGPGTFSPTGSVGILGSSHSYPIMPPAMTLLHVIKT